MLKMVIFYFCRLVASKIDRVAKILKCMLSLGHLGMIRNSTFKLTKNLSALNSFGASKCFSLK